MNYLLRPYQQSAHDAIVGWVRSNTEPCLIEAATGAGKSLIVAAIANTLNRLSGGKKILCIQPSKELLEQNFEKFLLTTKEPASLFSASVGQTSLRHPVVFGTPLTVKNKIHRFSSQFCAVIIDECHGITPTIKHIVEELRGKNQKLRVIGMTATPYRLGSGYIYSIDEKDRHLSEKQARDPYFKKKVYHIGARELIEQDYLTMPVVSETGQHYDTLSMSVNSRGQFDKADVDRAYHGHGRKTAHIVADVIARSKDRKGVMFFAATVRHAEEILASLPPELSAIVTGETPKEQRASILRRYKQQQLKYIVNVAVLTVGFDAPHVDVIALLRATESVGLLQQIIGRGLRVAEDKKDCLILDYAQNIDRHCPDGDIFAPDIRAYGEKKESADIEAHCPLCATVNVFSARKNDEGFQVDENGYFVDLAGMRIQTEFGFMPAHYGRRCLGGEPQCNYRWTFKPCPVCNAENDIAARYCCECKAEIIDPNEKLKADFKAFKSDPTQIQTDEIISYQTTNTLSQSGNEVLRADIVTPYRSFSVWAIKSPKNHHQKKTLDLFQNLEESPQTITYKKLENGFYRVYSFNDKIDELLV